MISKDLAVSCMQSGIANLENYILLLKLALNTTGNKDSIALAMTQNHQIYGDRSECRVKGDEVKPFLHQFVKDNLRLSDYYSELTGIACTLSLKVIYRLDINNVDDNLLFNTLDNLAD